MKKRIYLPVHVGDEVTITFMFRDNPAFDARVTHVRERLESTPLISYERLDGVPVDMNHCDISYVTKIVRRAPYVCVAHERVNIFSKEFPGGAKIDGLRHGSLIGLIADALSSVKGVDLAYHIHKQRAEELFAKAYYPGKVLTLNEGKWWRGSLTVRWKTFRRWAQQNAQRLIMSKAEARAEAIAMEREFQEEYWHDVSDELESSWTWLDDVEPETQYYGTQGGGLAKREGGRFYFVEDPNCPGLKVGDEVPNEWGIVPAHGVTSLN